MNYQLNQKNLLVAIGICALLIAVAVALVRTPDSGNLLSVNGSFIGNTTQAPARTQAKRVKAVRLWPQFQNTLQAMGNRLEAVGKERLILVGTIRRNSARAVETPMRLVIELPDRFRLEEQIGNGLRVTTFDGEKQDGLKRSDGNISDERDVDEIESLIFDSVEHLFSGQMEGLAKREIGTFLQPNEKAVANYAGPYYNVYEVMDRITHTPTLRSQRKLYYFNAENSLPEIIRYRIERGRGSLNVEIRLADWQNFNGQLIPKIFTRLENNAEALQLRVAAASIQPTANDGIFSIPGR